MSASAKNRHTRSTLRSTARCRRTAVRGHPRVNRFDTNSTLFANVFFAHIAAVDQAAGRRRRKARSASCTGQSEGQLRRKLTLNGAVQHARIEPLRPVRWCPVIGRSVTGTDLTSGLGCFRDRPFPRALKPSPACPPARTPLLTTLTQPFPVEIGLQINILFRSRILTIRNDGDAQ